MSSLHGLTLLNQRIFNQLQKARLRDCPVAKAQEYDTTFEQIPRREILAAPCYEGGFSYSRSSCNGH
jgi:hypothetical protein